MAITIIQEGSLPTVKCPHCTSVLAYEHTDVESTFGNHTSRKYITCPLCGFAVFFDEGET